MYITGDARSTSSDGVALDGASYYAIQAAEFAASGCKCARCGGPITRVSDADVGPHSRYLIHRAGACRTEGLVS